MSSACLTVAAVNLPYAVFCNDSLVGLYEATLALGIKSLYKTLIPNQIRRRCARILNMDWY